MEYLKCGIKIIKMLKENGFAAFFVGGFVRDFLLGIHFNDIDIATNALPKDVSNIFSTIASGIKYNSITVVMDEYRFELTTYREDLEYNDHRHPSYRVAKSLLDDLKRRDFTINAMAMDENYHIIDIFNGQSDLHNKLIKTVNEPIRRFTEDALRMLRACYFAAKLNFTIEEKTLTAITKCNYLIQHLSNDRIVWELEKIVNAPYSMKGYQYLIETNLLYFLPDFEQGIKLIYTQKLTDLSWLEFLAICFYDNQEKVNEYSITTSIKSDLKPIFTLMKMDLCSNDVVYKYGVRLTLQTNKLKVILNQSFDYKDEIVKIDSSLPIHAMSELAIKAKDILAIVPNVKSKDINSILTEVSQKVINKKIDNSYNDICHYILNKYK